MPAGHASANLARLIELQLPAGTPWQLLQLPGPDLAELLQRTAADEPHKPAVRAVSALKD